MYNSDTELLFPLRVIPALNELRSETWQELIGSITIQDDHKVDQIAFVLLMVRLGGCVTCNSDSFRAMRGCTACARQTIRRFRGKDKELIDQFQQSRQEVLMYLNKHSINIDDIHINGQ